MLRAARTEDALQASGPGRRGLLGHAAAGHGSCGACESRRARERGAPLITIEAMKMEHTVTAPYAGTVERMPFGLSDRVAAGAVLVELSLARRLNAWATLRDCCGPATRLRPQRSANGRQGHLEASFVARADSRARSFRPAS